MVVSRKSRFWSSDNSIRLLSDAYLKLEELDSKAGTPQEQIETLKIKITNNTVKRVSFIDRRKNLLSLAYVALFSLTVGCGYVFVQSFAISKEILTAKNDLFQVLSEDLERQYQQTFDTLKTELEKKVDENFNRLNATIMSKLTKESELLQKMTEEQRKLTQQALENAQEAARYNSYSRDQ